MDVIDRKEERGLKILLVRTVPGEVLVTKATYNEQYLGLARALIKAGHQCDIICGEENGVRTEEVAASNGKSIKVFFVKATTILKNNILHFEHSIFSQYDVIQTGEYNQIYTWHLAKECREKCVVFHGPYFSEFNKRYNLMAKLFDALFLRRYIKLNTKFITKSRYAADYLSEKRIRNVKSIGVGIDLQSFEHEEDLYDSFFDDVKNFNVDIKLLYIGRLEPRRNSYFLLDVLKTMRENGYNTGLIVIGRGDKEYVDKFLAKIRAYGLEQYVLYKSAMEQKYLPEVYRLADIFLLPTLYDIYGMVILEAMYFGIPVISSPCGGAQMMIQSGKNGIIIDGFDEKEWTLEVTKLKLNPELYNRISSCGHKTIKERFTWDALVSQFIEAYQETIKGN